MTARTSPETRAELARLLDAAEPLPWRVHRDPDLAHTWWIVSGDRHLMEAGAVYATAAANALPDLLADLADAEAEQERLTAERDELRAGAQADAWLGESVARLLTAETARGRSERDALAAKLDAVREWIDKRGVDVSDRDDVWMAGYRAAQRHALQNALELRRTLDGEG